MKNIYLKASTSLAFLFLLFLTTTVSAQLTLPATSPEAEVTQRVGITDITIHYNRPYVKGRKVWGGLVQYGFNDPGFGTSKSAPWRSGADYNTTIEFTHDVKFEGKDVKAKNNADKLQRLEGIRIPENFDYRKLKSLSYEAMEKLIAIRPVTISQASRISGVSPNDISVLLVYMGR